jgi:hypothetical protein
MVLPIVFSVSSNTLRATVELLFSLIPEKGEGCSRCILLTISLPEPASDLQEDGGVEVVVSSSPFA